MYLEDYIIGKTYPLEETSFTEEEIIKFAKEFDPRPIHLDKEAAKDLFSETLSPPVFTPPSSVGRFG